MGRRLTKRQRKEKKREAKQVQANYRKGAAAVKRVKARYVRSGHTVRGIRTGADFVASKPGEPDKYVEVKSGPGPHEMSGRTANKELRPEQQRMKRRHGPNYRIERDY